MEKYKGRFIMFFCNKEERAITLITLAITIIVLLILAGVTIYALSGDNGILRQAINTKEHVDIEVEKEQIELATLESLTSNAGDELSIPNSWKNTVKLIADGEGKYFVLPNGFFYVGGSVDTGVVISDKKNDSIIPSESEGNQFV